jgi:hypothetical protein
MDDSINTQHERDSAQDIQGIVTMKGDQSHAEGDKKRKSDGQGPGSQHAERQGHAEAKGHVTAGKIAVRRPKIERAIDVRQKGNDQERNQGAQKEAAFRGNRRRKYESQENQRHDVRIVVGQKEGHDDGATISFFLQKVTKNGLGTCIRDFSA